MKKHGFTLAEVLITLGIIGVVAALTTPTLVQNINSQQVGPRLAKAVSTLELANQNLLNHEEMTSLRSTGAFDHMDGPEIGYLDKLSDYMYIDYNWGGTRVAAWRATDYNGEDIATKAPETFRNALGRAFTEPAMSNDGVIYSFSIFNADTNPDAQPHKRGCGLVLIDVNGLKTPNRLGKDVFAFELFENGILRAVGANAWSQTNADFDYGYENANEETRCNADAVDTGWTCAGSIIDNNLKVIYQ